MSNGDAQLLPQVFAILETLLQQSEQPERKRVVRIHINQRDHAWYFASAEIGLRKRIYEQLQALEARGWLHLHWHKYEEGHQLKAIDLVAQGEQLADLYAMLQRVPAHAMKEALQQLLSAQEQLGGWFDAFVAWALAQLRANRSPAPLSLTDMQDSRDLLLALSTLAHLRTPLLERTFSVQCFGNSKRLEKLRPALLSVLRAHAPEASSYGDDDTALLRAFYVHRSPAYTYLTGPLTLLLEGIHYEQTQERISLELAPSLTSIGLAENSLRTASIVACSATALITVENLTSFNELLLVRPPSVLVIFTGGFASPSLITFLTRIHTHHLDLPLFHWGDLDAGGLRILAHLRHHLSLVRPLGMDRQTFESYRAHTQPLTINDKTNLQSLLKHPQLDDCQALIEHLMATGLKLEQEAVDAELLLRTLL